MNGFTLHANRYIGSKQRAELYSLISYGARPALSEKRLTQPSGPEATKGDLLYELKSKWRDGTSHIVLSPGELLERLCALVPPPRGHLTRYFGVLSSHSKVRKHIVLDPDVKKGYVRERCDGKSNTIKLSWSKLLARVFQLDLDHCPRCGSERFKIVSSITEEPVIQRILTAMGLEPRPPPVAPPRQQDLAFFV